jgi:uncharacterized protein YecE (DUF72 family)
MYKHWGERFYPKDLKKGHLEFYAKEFETVEINSSFYRMPSEHAMETWRDSVPRSFVFAVKMNQYITHRKRLILDDESKRYLKTFMSRCQLLEGKLGPILIQLPPSFKDNYDRLNDFFKHYKTLTDKLKFKPKSAIEFRHESWFTKQTYDLLTDYGIALVLLDNLEKQFFSTDFAYVRMHGNKKHESEYLEKQLKEFKAETNVFPKKVKKIFVYFNNDYSAYAIENARFLKVLVESKQR